MTSLATSLSSLPKRQAGGPNGAVTLDDPEDDAQFEITLGHRGDLTDKLAYDVVTWTGPAGHSRCYCSLSLSAS